jgi:hypothetical protein
LEVGDQLEGSEGQEQGGEAQEAQLDVPQGDVSLEVVEYHVVVLLFEANQLLEEAWVGEVGHYRANEGREGNALAELDESGGELVVYLEGQSDLHDESKHEYEHVENWYYVLRVCRGIDTIELGLPNQYPIPVLLYRHTDYEVGVYPSAVDTPLHNDRPREYIQPVIAPQSINDAIGLSTVEVEVHEEAAIGILRQGPLVVGEVCLSVAILHAVIQSAILLGSGYVVGVGFSIHVIIVWFKV